MTADDPTVYIVDDDDAVRSALCALLASVHLPTRAFPSAEVFLQAAEHGMRGCLLLDVRMPVMSGLEVLQVLRERGIGLPVIMLTGYSDVPMAVRAMKSGAIDFIEKPFNEQDLLERIQAGLAADAAAFQHRRELQSARERLDNLSQREREVAELLAQGQVGKRIATQLGISDRTVDVHRFNIMRKLGVRGLAELLQLWNTAHPT